MLVLNRKIGEEIIIDLRGKLVRLIVIEIRGGIVRLGIQAPAEVPVHRKEVWNVIQAANQEQKG